MVRHVSATHGAHHPSTDDCIGSDIYGIYDGDAQSLSTWSIQFDNIQFNQFLFAFGDCSTWLVTSEFEAIGENYDAKERCIFNSSEASKTAPYSAIWYNRGSSDAEDPWISTLNSDESSDKMVYGEDSNSNNFDGPLNHGGSNVWIRNKVGEESRWCFESVRPTVLPTDSPTPQTSEPTILPTGM